METESGSFKSGDGLSGRPIRELTKDLVSQAERLIRAEVRLARAEIKDEAKGAALGGVTAGAGTAILYGGVLALIFCVAAALATAWPVWLALLVTGVGFTLLGALVAMGGAQRIRQTRLSPRETRTTLEEDRRWASETMHGIRSKTRANA